MQQPAHTANSPIVHLSAAFQQLHSSARITLRGCCNQRGAARAFVVGVRAAAQQHCQAFGVRQQRGCPQRRVAALRCLRGASAMVEVCTKGGFDQ